MTPLVMYALEMGFQGGTRRALDLLIELSREFTVDLRLLPREPLSDEQLQQLQPYAWRVSQIPRRDRSRRDQLAIAARAIRQGIPYHAAVVEHSFAADPATRALRPRPDQWVYAALMHWTVPLHHAPGPRWVVDQWDADVHYWEVQAQQLSHPVQRLVARLNRQLTYRHCKRVYPRVGRLLSVCEEDRELSLQIAPTAKVDVIRNGLDCDYYTPARDADPGPTVLFTGTSDARNLKALRFFMTEVYPLLRREVPEVRFVLGGNFSAETQREYAGVPGVSATGRVPDIRPLYHQCAVFVSPYEDASGTKMKVSEALATGTCLVSLPMGIRGLPLVDGENVLLGHDGPHMARQIARALTDPALARRIGANGRRFAEQHLDWKHVLGPRLRQIVADVAEPVVSKEHSLAPLAR